jgi:predicted CopG family antitoxin
MPTRTISVREEAYERLRRARRTPSESFSDVIMRAVWPDAPLRGATLLDLVRERGPIYQPAELAQIEAAADPGLPASQ